MSVIIGTYNFFNIVFFSHLKILSYNTSRKKKSFFPDLFDVDLLFLDLFLQNLKNMFFRRNFSANLRCLV